MKWIDRAERRFGHLAVPHLIHGIAFLSAVSFVLYKINPQFFSLLMLVPRLVLEGQVWRLVTYLFIPSLFSLIPLPDWVNAVFYVLFMIWMSNGLEEVWGPFKVNVYCLITVVGITVAAFFFGSMSAQLLFFEAIFFAFARYYPDEIIYLAYILPVKVKWMAWGNAAWLLYTFIFSGDPGFRAGLICTMAAYLLFFGKEIVHEAQHRQEVSARRQRFENAVRAGDDAAIHRCEVCGRTELQAPDLEFRVAKDGHEYCVEHLPKAPPPAAGG